MNMNHIYENRHLIPEEHVDHFEKHRKQKLNMVEKIGLEAILCEFVKQYELDNFTESYTNYAPSAPLMSPLPLWLRISATVVFLTSYAPMRIRQW